MNPDISEDVFASIIQTITSGWTVQAALDDHLVSRYDYDKAKAKDPIKSRAHARAREDCADAMADDIPYIADTEPDPQRAKNRIDARKWLTGVVKPREYGQRLDLTVTSYADPAELNRLGMERVRLMRDPAAPLALQVIDDAVLIPANATDSQSVAASIWD